MRDEFESEGNLKQEGTERTEKIWFEEGDMGRLTQRRKGAEGKIRNPKHAIRNKFKSERKGKGQQGLQGQQRREGGSSIPLGCQSLKQIGYLILMGGAGKGRQAP